MNYGYSTTLDLSYEEAIEKVTEALKTEGFGVLTEIDVQATMKKKIDVDMERYVILGACNPHLAHQALQAEKGIGLMLPCNVIVYEDTANSKSVVSIVNPDTMLGVVPDNEDLNKVAEAARTKLMNVFETLKSN